MSEICLFRWETALGPAEFACFQNYVLYGIILILIGLLMLAFIPLMTPKKVGVGLIVLGLILSVGISFIANLWEENQIFRISVYSAFVFVVIMIIVFSDNQDEKVFKKK